MMQNNLNNLTSSHSVTRAASITLTDEEKKQFQQEIDSLKANISVAPMLYDKIRAFENYVKRNANSDYRKKILSFMVLEQDLTMLFLILNMILFILLQQVQVSLFLNLLQLI
ncbi:MAG: hypothetical protein K2Q14_08615 [Gammaproteobacteria bacterium]|nr:hypothetical protein [Gammaproteobacteria bacterium]